MAPVTPGVTGDFTDPNFPRTVKILTVGFVLCSMGDRKVVSKVAAT